MARQLRARGHSVALLALFNSMPPNSSSFKARWTPRLALRFIQNSWAWLGYFRHWKPEQRRDFFRRKARLLKKNAGRLLSLPLFVEKAGLRPAPPKIEAQDWLDPSTYPESERKLSHIHLRNLPPTLPHTDS